MNKDEILKDFNSYSTAKKQNVVFTKLVLVFAFCVVSLVLFWGYSVANKALEKVIVVERSGEYLKISAESNEKLFTTLIKNTCAQLTYYTNSFDRLTINENQAKAMFYCNKEDLQRIFNLYKDQRLYHDAMEQGVIYKCELTDFHFMGNEEPYQVRFNSILTIINGSIITQFLIESEGSIVKINPQFPENVTGFFFNSYQQTIKRVDNGQTKEN